jgi:CDP-diacylglycerol--glycerol-3-phosphate 3-phosphatidyltransferase
MNLPNVLSFFRLCLVPVFVLVYFSSIAHSGILAVIVYGVAALSDVLDGKIARKYNMTSTLGKILDPLGDKLMTFVVLVCITIDKVVPLWAVLIFVVKESLMGIGGLVLYKKLSDMPSSNYFGKCSTIVFFAVCVILIIFKSSISHLGATIMISVAIAVTLVAFVSYVLKFTRIVGGGKTKQE